MSSNGLLSRYRIAESYKFQAHAAGELYRQHYEFAQESFWKARATDSRRQNTIRTSPPVALDQRVQISSRVKFVPRAIVNERYVIKFDAVELNGTTYGRLGNFSIPFLLDATTRPISTKDLLQYWSADMPAALAMQVLEWLTACGLIEAVK